jgi:hypothetical protein
MLQFMNGLCKSPRTSGGTARDPRLGLLLALLFATTSCEKIVNLDLQTSTAQLVIEGNLVDDNKPCQVSVRRTANYTDTNTFAAVSGATITLADNAGGLETLRETATPGQYLGATLRGVPGRTYTLRVETSGAAYVATSRLPAPVVPFEKLSTQLSAFGTDNIQAVVDYTDPAGRGNSYLFRQYRNGKLNNAVFVQNDEFTDGNRISQALRTRSSSSTDPNELDKLVPGDSLRVEMQNIDPGVYEYYRTLSLILTAGGAPTTTPANPKSNFSGGVLGYFSAHSRRVLTIKVP